VILPIPVAAAAAGRASAGARMAAVVAADRRATVARSRRCMAASLVAHALLLAALLLVPRALPQAPALTEFTMLEPGDLAPEGGVPSAPAPAAAAQSGTAAPQLADESFRRSAETAEIEPRPQSDDAYADRIASRLATLVPPAVLDYIRSQHLYTGPHGH